MSTSPSIQIRSSLSSDAGVLRLAQLDSRSVPEAPYVIAEVEGQPRAALSLSDGSAVADPFYRSADLVTLLRAHAGTRAGRRARGFATRLRESRLAHVSRRRRLRSA